MQLAWTNFHRMGRPPTLGGAQVFAGGVQLYAKRTRLQSEECGFMTSIMFGIGLNIILRPKPIHCLYHPRLDFRDQYKESR